MTLVDLQGAVLAVGGQAGHGSSQYGQPALQSAQDGGGYCVINPATREAAIGLLGFAGNVVGPGGMLGNDFGNEDGGHGRPHAASCSGAADLMPALTRISWARP